MGLSGLCPFPLRRMTLREQRGGGNRIISGGVQNRFWGGALWYVFPSPEFPPPLFFSEVGVGVSETLLTLSPHAPSILIPELS